jgi:hypothetical protein
MAFPLVQNETKDSLLKYSATNVPFIFISGKERNADT